MTTPDEPVEKRSVMDKYVASILQGLILAAIVAASGLLLSQNKTMSDMSTQIALVQFQLKDMKDASGNYLTKTDADQRGKMRDMQIETIKSDISIVKSDIVELKKTVHK